MKYLIDEVTLEEMADKIREKTQSTGKISVQDFAVQIKEIPTAEDLDIELNAQDTELLTQDSKIDEIFSALENVGESEFNVKVDSAKIPANSSVALLAGITEIGKIDTSKITSIAYLFQSCSSLETIPLINTSNVTNMSYVFRYCSSLKFIPLIDTSNVINMSYMFSDCTKLETIPQLNTKNVTNMGSIFSGCSNLRSVPSLDTSKVTSVRNMFNMCNKLESIGLMDFSKVTDMSYFGSNLFELTHVGGFKNLGQAYSISASTGNSSYTLPLSSATKLTRDSLINVINNLYDIATKGCKAQNLVLGSTNLNKLTEEEKAIATTKGWTLS